MPGKKHAALSILSLPDDILVLVMKQLIYRHACPKPLLRFLIATKQLCTPRFEMFKTVVEPFLLTYLTKMFRDRNRFWDKAKMLVTRRALLKAGDRLTCTMLLDKVKQLDEHTAIVAPYLKMG